MRVATTLALVAASLAAANPAHASKIADLTGTWTLVAADLIKTDGSVVRDYGESPKGRLIVDASGRYSLQIYKSERVRFNSALKADGTEPELRSAVLGSSTHYGQLRLESGQLQFNIEGASFPNWEGTVQKRSFEIKDGRLRYLVPARADGNVPVSIWRRLSRHDPAL